MISMTINQENMNSMQLEASFFKYCELEKFPYEGGHIDSDFIDCTFENIDWYWGLFNTVNFVGCKFKDCVFKGTCFADCRFVECELFDCQFIKDNLNRECSFENSKSFSTEIINCIGFNLRKI